jgi:hypothetical protein
VTGTLAIGAILLALLVAWVTGAFRAPHERSTWLAIALFVAGDLLLVLSSGTLVGALGIAAMIGAIVVMLRARRSAS